MADKRFKIRIDRKTIYTVLEHQLYKKKWIEYFGGVDKVKEFIKNYNS